MAASAKTVHGPQRRTEARPAPKAGGKRERTREKILEAAFELIGNEKGLTVRIEEICAKAHISRGTFYNYFTSLDRLFEVLAIELSADLNRALVSTWDETQSHAEGSNAAIQHYLNYARRDPAWAWAMVHLSAFGPSFGAGSVGRVLPRDCEGYRSGGIRRAECDGRPRPDDRGGSRRPCVPRSAAAGHSRESSRTICCAHWEFPNARAREIAESPLPDIIVPK